jgi:hypothetical protein
MTKYTVFSKDALFAAVEIGSIRGYNRSLTEEGIREFKDKIEAGGNESFPVAFSEIREYIARKKVKPHVRAVVQLDVKGSQFTLDVDMDLFNGLPVFDTETKSYGGAVSDISGASNTAFEKGAKSTAIKANPTGCAYWNKPEDMPSTELAKASDIVERFDDTSHLMHALIKCWECGQLYYYEYYDEVDYEDGDDPVFMTYIPVDNDEEIERLKALSRSELMSVVPRLHYDIPKGADAPLVRWVKEKKE